MAQKTLDNRLGVKGWAVGGSWGFERYLYTLHRITGIALILYFMMHILVTAMRALGEERWAAIMGAVDNPLLHLGEWLVFMAFVFHAMNGIRLVLIELGFMVGKPIEPIYPYATCIDKQRPLTLILMLIAFIWVILGGYNFFLMSN